MLKNIPIITSLILFVLSVLVFSQGAKAENEKVYRFVYSLSAMHVTSADDADAVATILAEHIRKKNRRIEKIEITICKNKAALLEQLKKGYDFLVVSTGEFLLFRKQFNLLPAFTNETNGSVGFNYLLVVNKDEQISNIRQLKGAEIYIQAQSSQETPELLINNLLKEQKLLKMDQFFSKITKLASTNNAVLPVFFKKAKAALVTEQSLNILREINPQIEKQLKVIYRSPSLILGLSCFNGSTILSDNKKLMTEILTNLHTDPYGRQLLNLFSTDKLVPYEEEFLKEYLRLFEKK